jgi:GAF domain-containing protein
MATREALLARTFVETADTLVQDFDVVEFLTTLTTRCVDLFDATEAGIMLADRFGGLQVAASSSRTMGHLELFELQHDEGPCVDCYRDARFVASVDLNDDLSRWPRFAPEALSVGMRAAWALPLRLRATTIGSLNLLRNEPGVLSDDDLTAAQALGDVATIALIQQRAAEDAQLLNEQLQTALGSRIVIEQAKGVLAEYAGLGMDAAFDHLRQYARSHERRLSDLARDVASRDLALVRAIAPRRDGIDEPP